MMGTEQRAKAPLRIRPHGLLFARHGETDYTRDSLLQGWRDVPLNDAGIRQVEALADRLSGARVRRVIASPLARAWRTAAAIAARHELEVIAEPRLRERRWGSLEGSPRASRTAPYPADVEPIDDFQARICAAIADMGAVDGTLVVSHSGVLRQLGVALTGRGAVWALEPAGVRRLVYAEAGGWQAVDFVRDDPLLT